MKEKGQVINLNERFPNVLLIGNGPFRNTGLDWKMFIKKTAKEDANVNEFFTTDNKLIVPNTIATIAITETDDNKRHKKYTEVINEIKKNSNVNTTLKGLVSLNFDAILTTNYTYELEELYDNNFCRYSDKKMQKIREYYSNDPDAKYLIHTCNKLENANCGIWHIHGEFNRHSSIVLTHDEYAKLINKIIERNTKIGTGFVVNRNKYEFKSWVDYMIVGNLYILGQGLSYEEFDLWWLLSRRIREKSEIGKGYFYDIDDGSEEYKKKKKMLESIGIKVESLGMKINEEATKEEINKKYQLFYEKAINDINEKLERES